MSSVYPSLLTVLGEGSNSRMVRCRCACGTEREFNRWKVASHHTKSCGCATRRMMGDARIGVGRWQGVGKRKTFDVWRSVLARCYKKYTTGYHKYGGRGIKVCRRWRESYAAFFADMGDCPDGLTIDRINNDGDYGPGNCQWATAQQQARNRRSTRLITFRGRTQCLQAWADELCVQYKTLAWRIAAHGVAKALTTPPPKRKGHNARTVAGADESS